MNSSVFSFLSDFVFLLLLFIQIPSSLSNDDLFTACRKEFECGGISAGFPFWGTGRPAACGVHELELKCESNSAKMNISQVTYRVLEINREFKTLRIAREDYLAGLCPSQFVNSTFNPEIFESDEGNRNFTLIYGCEDASAKIPGRRTFNCKTNDGDDQSGYIKEGESGPGECNGSVIVPVSITDFPPVWNMPAVEEQLKKGFEVRWKVDMGLCPECFISSGVCGFDNVTNQATCHCPDQSSGSKPCALPPSPPNVDQAIPPPDFVFLLLLFIQIPSSLSNDDLFTACRKEFVCGGISAGFPFWGNGRPPACGIPEPELELRCESNFAKMNNITTININQVAYRVLEMNQSSQILRIEREDYLVGLCPPQFMNSFNPKIFEPVEGYSFFTFIYGCKDVSTTIPSPKTFTCKINDINNRSVYNQEREFGPGECNGKVTVPVSIKDFPPDWNMPTLEERFTKGFEVRWKVDRKCRECSNSSGVCGFDNVARQTTCYYPASPSIKRPLKIGLSSAGAVVGAFLGCWIMALIQRRRRKAALEKSEELPIATPSSKGPATSINLSRTTPSLTSLKSDIDKGSTYFGVRVFSYDELEEVTNFFDSSRELGDGGFGTVYYGVLRDGHEVAVKRLYENNMKRTEQFMNEIEILAHIRHQNLVKLHGCTSRHSRELLLVYEYIPNGTVADHLHGRQSSSGLLTWPVRLSIAIETASALAHLHASDVIHRDVKTNNILLDNDFRVKVADFGLSRLFPTDVTHVSTAPQGTPGYVDPEYYQCYQLTSKSDVYSFGVVLIELISSLQAVDTNRHRHDINLSNMAVSMIQNQALNELVDPLLGIDKNIEVRRMVTSVAELAFRCLQRQREMRPSMEEVLEVLKRIEKEDDGAEKAEVLDISEDDVGLLKHDSSPLKLSEDSLRDQFWESSSSTKTPHSF